MNDNEIRKKYGLNSRRHAVLLFIQMLLLIVGLAIGLIELTAMGANRVMCWDVVLCFAVLIGYAIYGYQHPAVSVQATIMIVAVINILAVLISLAGGKGPDLPALIILLNCLIFAAGLIRKRNFRLSQTVLGICLAADLIRFIMSLFAPSGVTTLYIALNWQFMNIEGTLMLISYSHRVREQNRAAA